MLFVGTSEVVALLIPVIVYYALPHDTLSVIVSSKLWPPVVTIVSTWPASIYQNWKGKGAWQKGNKKTQNRGCNILTGTVPTIQRRGLVTDVGSMGTSSFGDRDNTGTVDRSESLVQERKQSSLVAGKLNARTSTIPQISDHIAFNHWEDELLKPGMKMPVSWKYRSIIVSCLVPCCYWSCQVCSTL